MKQDHNLHNESSNNLCPLMNSHLDKIIQYLRHSHKDISNSRLSLLYACEQ
jgi:hypothetical protein